MSDHPHIKVLWYTKKNGEKVYSSAAGAYQVMGYTWSDNNMINKRKTYNIKDFSAEGQDKFCIVLFKYKREGILDLIIKGDIKEATEKYGSYEWASLPPGRYGQPIETIEKALELYNNFYQEELSGKSPLYLKKGFLKEFGYNCCEKDIPKSNSVNSLCGKSEIDLREKVKWQTQFDPKWGGRDRQMVACKKTCDDILINSGLKATSLSKLYQTAIENSEHSKLIINNQISKEAIMYLDSELEKGHPVQVGVDHGLGYKIDNNLDQSTDHFVVIIGRKCEGSKCYYLFYDVGTSHKEKGASDNNRLYLDKTDYSLRGKTVYNGHFYTVTQIRKN
ncbi:glycoside hydrolase family 104 protein [Chryseobacterium sp. POE27]|uniref:glycoside hydrolase family 24 protein n=1 Tax=Chryseobacterium sp. POE27 TaxID=3138177 RepID=UPI00321AFB09